MVVARVGAYNGTTRRRRGDYGVMHEVVEAVVHSSSGYCVGEGEGEMQGKGERQRLGLKEGR